MMSWIKLGGKLTAGYVGVMGVVGGGLLVFALMNGVPISEFTSSLLSLPVIFGIGLAPFALFAVTYKGVMQIGESIQEFKGINELYRCEECSRVHRKWQRILHKAMHDENVCVHCGREVQEKLSIERDQGIDSLRRLIEQRKFVKTTTDLPKEKEFTTELHHLQGAEIEWWMKGDPDCEYKTRKQWTELRKTVEKAESLVHESRDVRSYDRYRELREPSHWMRKETELFDERKE